MGTVCFHSWTLQKDIFFKDIHILTDAQDISGNMQQTGMDECSWGKRKETERCTGVLHLCYYLSTFFLLCEVLPIKRHKSFAFRFYILSQTHPLSSRSGSQLPDFQLLPCIFTSQHSQYKTRWWSSSKPVPPKAPRHLTSRPFEPKVCVVLTPPTPLAPTSNPPWCLWIL